MYRQILLVCAALVGLGNSELILGTCPDWSSVSEFDLPSYVGRWYEIENFETGYELEMICITADYGELNETAITVINSGTVLNQLVQIEGIAVGTSEAGQFDLYFPDVTPGKYNVLYTDYETYSCVYSCEQVGEFMQQYGWVLARTPTIDNATLDAAEAVFEENGIDISLFSLTEQPADCFYVEP